MTTLTSVKEAEQKVACSEPSTTVKEKIVRYAIESMQEIAKDSFDRLGQYEQNPKVLESGIWYSSDYMTALKKTGQLRKFATLQEQGDYYHGMVPSDYFVHDLELYSPTGKGFYQFTLHPKQCASSAVKAMKQGLCLLECATATDLVQYDAILKTIGPKKFDRIFAAQTKTPLSFNLMHHGKLPLQLLAKARKLSPKETVSKGQFCYLNGYGNFLSKHPLGGHCGFNTLCSEKERFLGLGLPVEGNTTEQLKSVFVEGYNQTPTWKDILGPRIVSSYFSPTELSSLNRWQDHQITIEDLEKDGGTISPAVREFQYDRIEKLVQSSLRGCEEWIHVWRYSDQVDRSCTAIDQLIKNNTEA